MRHRVLTCRNHPHLRWACKEIAWSGFYNGSRSIFYNGTVQLDEAGNPIMFYDNSGVEARHTEAECKCPASDLILAPEDKIVMSQP